jgi:hypothetical protein
MTKFGGKAASRERSDYSLFRKSLIAFELFVGLSVVLLQIHRGDLTIYLISI